jgi:hypothetical protein
MLPNGLNSGYRQALASPHEEYIRIDVLDGAGNVLPIPVQQQGIDGGLKIISGDVTATLTSNVTRNLSITVDETLYPVGPGYLLAPYGNRIQAVRGIKFATGDRFAWTVFTGRIQDDVNAVDGQVTLTAADRANEVVEAKFLYPTNSSVGVTISQQWIQLISGGVPDAVFGASDSFGQQMPSLAWSDDRAGAATEVSTSVGAYWYCLADGRFVQRLYPWTVPGASILTLTDGIGGVVAGAPSRDRSNVYNSITVTAERADGSAPLYAVAQDTNPLSPTYIGGNFGFRHLSVPLQTPTSIGASQAAADAYLKSTIALTEAWTWAMPPDASLELGDIVTLDARGESGIIQVLASFVMPLTPDGTMACTGRAQVVGGLS